MANYRAGLRILDISNIGSENDFTSMTETGYFDTYPANNGTAFNGAWSVYPYFASGNLIINDIERGLLIVRKSGTLSLTNQQVKQGFFIAPNPMSATTTISFSNNETIKNIKIYNVLGQKVLEKNNINQTKYVLTKNTLQKGVYIIKVNALPTQKLVIQ